MARLPVPGGDNNVWGDILVEYLSQSLDTQGNIKAGAVTKAAVGLGNVDNTSDATKNSATATLTNKIISGGSNTLSGIGNGSLANSAITIAGTSTSLGGSITQDTITGLSSAGLIKRTSANTLATATAGTDYAGVGSTAQTLSATRLAPRVGTTISSATPPINTDSYDQFNITALAVAITSMTTSLAGTPTDGQKLLIRIKDNGTARAITWGASFQSSGIAALPTTTIISKTHMVGLIYDSVVAKWVCAAVDATGY